jgi:hypothetical protein
VSGTVALARAGKKTLGFVADEDTRRVTVLDVDRGSELVSVGLAASPGALLVSSGGNVLVTLPERSEVALLSFEGETLRSRCTFPTAPEPVALALTPDASTLLVASAWGHAFAAYSGATLAELYRLDLPRDPRAIVVSQDGTRAFVSHGVGGTLSGIDLASRRVLRTSLDAPPSPEAFEQSRVLSESLEASLRGVPEPQKLALKRQFETQMKAVLMPERSANHGYSLALSSRGRLLVPQVEVDPGRREMRSAGYGSGNQASVVPSVAVVDPKSLELEPHSIPAVPAWREVGALVASENCRLPRAAAMDDANGALLVVCLGSDVLVGYDASAPSPVDAEMLRVRVASGPTGVAVDPLRRRAVVWSQFERVLGIVPLPVPGAPLPAEDPPVRRIALAEPSGRGLTSAVALGRRLFHATDDPRIARDGRACASCHLGGRDDGLVWSTPRGPRRTKLLAGVARETAPYAWDGSSATLHEQIEGTLERLDAQGGLRAVEIDALVAYVLSLPGPPREVERGAEVERGRALFGAQATGCASCHAGDSASDGARHGVASATDADATAFFDTPSLAFLSGRAPYFHDGRYATLGALLGETGDKMGHTSHLSPAELAALEAFLETL